MLRVQTRLPAVVVHEATDALTWAELVNVPKRPNTKPATAMAAMRVIAMRITVARTGEIAFLCLEGLKFIGLTYLRQPDSCEWY
jgi:hypothetical protein